MSQQRTISVTGLGYVGLPVAIAFAQKQRVIGYDKNTNRIQQLQQGEDKTGEMDCTQLQQADIEYSDQGSIRKQANFHIVAVPTPIDDTRRPDLSILKQATQSLGETLQAGDIVVFESTVYPGVTEDVCVPLLEQASGLTYAKDFFVGYSPERINPGDHEHAFTKITKVVAGTNAEVTQIIADTYASVVTAGVHIAPSIKVAEAAKVIENTQRDLNIALMNELAMIFDKLSIDTKAVLEAASTKWNFLKFSPGLVGGHCIGVDPYYLTHIAQQHDYSPEVILAGRDINDGMGQYIAEQTIKQMILAGKTVKHASVGILGLTFKENCPDLRNTRVIDVIKQLQSYAIDVKVHDPIADSAEAYENYQVELSAWDSFRNLDALIICVAHDFYREKQADAFIQLLKPGSQIIDVKSILDASTVEANHITYWRL